MHLRRIEELQEREERPPWSAVARRVVEEEHAQRSLVACVTFR
jgi:hypothetical protein